MRLIAGFVEARVPRIPCALRVSSGAKRHHFRSSRAAAATWAGSVDFPGDPRPAHVVVRQAHAPQTVRPLVAISGSLEPPPRALSLLCVLSLSPFDAPYQRLAAEHP